MRGCRQRSADTAGGLTARRATYSLAFGLKLHHAQTLNGLLRTLSGLFLILVDSGGFAGRSVIHSFFLCDVVFCCFGECRPGSIPEVFLFC